MNNRTLGVALTADPSGMQAGLSSATAAAQDFAARTTASMGRVSAASASMRSATGNASKGIEGITLAGRAHLAAAQRFVADLQRQATAIVKTRVELLRMQAAQLGVSNQAEPLIAALNTSRASVDKYGKSTKEMAFAMRGVPAQLTDIFVSLQGGQRPITVLLQQGGQLKDMFGGIVPAARALSTTLLGMINVVTVAAAASVGLVAAYRMGAAEAETFNKTLVKTGNFAGTNVAQLMAMASSMDDLADVTQRRAAEALNQFAASGKVGADNLERFTAAAIAWERETGQAIEETVAKFAELGKSPVEASIKLNESMNYLTVSTYQQVKALEDAGRQTEAAALAQQLFADALDERTPQMLENIGLIEQTWRGVKGVIAETVDLMAGIGRIETPQAKLANLQAEYDQISGSSAHEERAAHIQAQIVGLRDLIKWQNAVSQSSAEQARQVRAYAEADREWSKILESNLDKKTRQELEIANIRKVGLALGLQEKDIQEQIAAYREKHAEKPKGGISTSQSEIARLKAALEIERQREEQLHASGGARSDLNQYEKQALVYGEKLALATSAQTRAQLEQNIAMAEEAGARKRANDEFAKHIKDSEASITAVRKQTATLSAQIATYGMGKSAIEAMTIADLENQLVSAQGLGASERTIELLRLEIEERQKLLGAMLNKEALDAQLKEWENWERELERIFEQVGQSLTDQIFEGGKSARDLLKDMFKALTLRIVVQPMLSGLQGMVTNQIGGMLGYSNPTQGGGLMGMASNVGSLHSAFSGGLTNSLSNGIGWVGEKLGSTAMQSFANGMVGFVPSLSGMIAGSGLAASLGTTIGTSASAIASTTFASSLGAGGAAAGGAAGLGAIAGAALPWIGGALAIGGLLAGSFSGESRYGGSYNWTPGAGTVRGKWDDGDPGAEANQAISSILDGAVNAINSAFKGVGSQAGLSYFMGWAESSEKGRGGTASGGRLNLGGSEVAFGTTRKGQGYGSTSGDLSEMIQNMTVDVYQTVIQAWQTGIDEFPQLIQDMIRGIDADSLSAEAAQALITQVQQTIDQVNALTAAFDQLPFERLKNLSFDATASLLQLAGGVESFVAAHDAYYQAVYSEQERLDQQRRDVERALGGLNMALPQTQAQYRALVESLDLTTQAGREAYTTLVGLAPAWTAVNEGMARAAQEATAVAISLATGRDGTFDVQKLAQQLADASEATFVQAMVQVFDSLAGRLSSIVDTIANERGAVQAAIRQINDLGAMTPEQILAQVAGINTAMPGAGGLLASQQAMQKAAAAQSAAGSALTSEQYRAALGQSSASSAAALVARREREMQSATAYLADQQATATRELTSKEKLEQWAFGDIFGDLLLPDDIKQARQALPGAQAAVERAAELLKAAQAAAKVASAQAGASDSILETVRKAKEAADAQYEKASKAAQKAQLDYADAMQNFAIDAGKSVSKLSSLREETLRYYEAQAALANLMKNSAAGLRKTVLDYRVSQLNPDDQFTYLQSEFEKAYSMALSTDGEVLAGYADKLSSMLNPLIEQANNTFGSQASLDSFIATALARAQNIAERVEGLTPTDYAADSLDVLNQIDATLASMESVARSAEQIMVDAINAGRDATVNGLRQVVNALTGKSVAAFATGGDHMGGWRIVGERGPELEATGASRIYSADQTRAIFSGVGRQDQSSLLRELVASNRAMRDELANLRIEARATATNTHKLVRQADRIELEGQLIRTEDGTPVKIVIQSAEAPVPVEVVA